MNKLCDVELPAGGFDNNTICTKCHQELSDADADSQSRSSSRKRNRHHLDVDEDADSDLEDAHSPRRLRSLGNSTEEMYRDDLPLSAVPTLAQSHRYILHLQSRLRHTRRLLDSAEVHCVMGLRENQLLKNRANKKTRKKEKRFRADAKLMTSGEGKAEWERQKAERIEKERQEAEKRLEKEKAAAEREIQRNIQATSGKFSGALSTKSKPDLQDIAAAFHISIDGSKQTIADRISKHMDSHPELNDDDRFTGLFHSRTRSANKAAQRRADAANSSSVPEHPDPPQASTSESNIDPTLLSS